MGYRIDYPVIRKLHSISSCRTLRAALTGTCFLLFLLLVGIFWEEGAAVLRGILFSGDWDVTANALEGLVGNLGNGMAAKEAFGQFCGQILETSGASVY